jgi:hypothetical protein
MISDSLCRTFMTTTSGRGDFAALRPKPRVSAYKGLAVGAGKLTQATVSEERRESPSAANRAEAAILG